MNVIEFAHQKKWLNLRNESDSTSQSMNSLLLILFREDNLDGIADSTVMLFLKTTSSPFSNYLGKCSNSESTSNYSHGKFSTIYDNNVLQPMGCLAKHKYSNKSHIEDYSK